MKPDTTEERRPYGSSAQTAWRKAQVVSRFAQGKSEKEVALGGTRKSSL